MIEKARRWIVSMIGSREHYAPPRALHERGLLHLFYTDLWVPSAQPLIAQLPGPLKRLSARYHHGLPREKVVAFNMAGATELLRLEYFKRTGREQQMSFFVREGQRFAERVARHIQRHGLETEPGVFFGFQYGALETMQMLKSSPVVTVLNQFDAAEDYNGTLEVEHARWPGWENSPPTVPEAKLRRWKHEHRIADVVFVNSEWTKKAIIKLGVARDKIVVGPLAYEGPSVPVPHRAPSSRPGPLKVLWVGSVILRKGIQYLIEAAKGLDPARFEFAVAGSVGISKRGLDSAPPNMRFLGLVPQIEIGRHYRDADVYVLPTLSDGFAATQIEAMAHGLPVITTPNCGDVVTSGVDGLIVQAGDANALRDALLRLERNRDEVEAMSRAALETAKRFTLANYAEKLVRGVEAVLAERGAPSAGPRS